MLTDKKIPGKLEQIEARYAALRFEKLATVRVEMVETREHFRQEPGAETDLAWKPVAPGTKWGDNWLTAWFRGDVTLPAACAGRRVFIRGNTGGETLFFADGRTQGVFDDNHPVVMLCADGESGRTHHVAFEAYAGHFCPGCMPQDKIPPAAPKSRTFGGIDLALEREDVTAFVFDLKVLRLLMKALDDNRLRKHRILHELAKVYVLVDAMPEETPETSWRPKLAQARDIMRPLLEARNGPTAPRFGIIGHSHIDTAWLWPLAETWRKCARTFSSILNLMEQYPDFLFLQSAPCHLEQMRQEYPELFARIQAMVAAGRWEPNGGMWVEPDCNLPSGEAFVRQLLVGQQATRAWFGYTADTLWLPDVFGYSAALPQILRGAGIKYFCTTKIGWNDTTRFPYDTFTWRGLDGTPVLAHFNSIHCWPDPETLTAQWNWVQHKDVQDRRLCAFGYGDGGGGPQAEMLEVARRVEDLEDCPRARYMPVSQFMQGVADELRDLPEWCGELYLELHRGTLTSIAGVKRGNRKSELAVRDAELLATLAAVRTGAAYPAARLNEVWKRLLTNQFHDILPGSSIAEVNDEAIDAFAECVAQARGVEADALAALGGTPEKPGLAALVVNTLSWERSGTLALGQIEDGLYPALDGVTGQWVETVEGHRRLMVAGLALPALSGVFLPLTEEEPAAGASSFTVSQFALETPQLQVRLDETGRIVSLIHKATGREVVKPGGALNTFLLGEDIPEAWDNWDIDRDQRAKQQPQLNLISREIVADGPLQFRWRSEYKLGTHSTLVQDMVFDADSARVEFETTVDWAERHQLLKVAFDLNVAAESARHEIQYGHVTRPTHQNLPQDRARFEVCAHKWTDLSDRGFGVALLNDCKYGIGVQGSELRLSLIKSGTHPDYRGDAGQHVFTYALQPHAGDFAVESVVRPAYELNVAPVVCPAADAGEPLAGLVSVDAPGIVIEAVKWAEKGNGFVVRLYEAGQCATDAVVTLNAPVTQVRETNLLEETLHTLDGGNRRVALKFRPFEIKTLFCGLG